MARHARPDRDDVLVLGTDVVDIFIRGDQLPGRFASDRDGTRPLVTFRTLADLYAWAAESEGNSAPERWRRLQHLRDRVDVLPYDERVAEKWRELRPKVSVDRLPRREAEGLLWTAATCVVRGLRLASLHPWFQEECTQHGLILDTYFPGAGPSPGAGER